MLTIQRQCSYLRLYLYLAAIEGFTGGLILFLIPGEGGPVLGYSLQRVALGGCMLLGGLLAGVLGWLTGRGGKTGYTLVGILQKILDPMMAAAIVVVILLTAGLTAFGFRTPAGYAAYALRLLPLFIWIDLLAIQAWFLFPSVFDGKYPADALKAFLARKALEIESVDKTISPVNKKIHRMLWLIFLVFLVPSANLSVFNGLPLSGLSENFFLILIIPFLFNKKLLSWLDGLTGVRRKWALAASIIILLMKILLFIRAEDHGFAGCYRTPIAPPPNGQCELSYENPFFRFGATRMDKTIDFPADHWDISFINSNRFNFQFWREGQILRDRLPLDVVWKGILQVDKQVSVLVEYVGEGRVEFAGESFELPAAYQKPARAQIILQPAEGNLRMHYRFDDGYRTRQGMQPGYRPALRTWVESPTGRKPLSSLLSPAPVIFAVVAALVDLFFWSLLLLLFVGVIRVLGWQAILVLAAGAMGFVFYWLLPEYSHIVLILLFLAVFSCLKPDRRILTAWLSLFLLAVFRTLVTIPDFQYNIIRIAGADPLSHESFARTILETGSMEAEEAVFYAQPFYRYLLLLLRLVFGDGDAFRSAVILALFNLGIFTAFDKLKIKRSLLAFLTTAAILWLANSNIPAMIQDGITEYPTWIILVWVFPLLTVQPSPRTYLLASILLGFSIITRTNHLPPILFLLGVNLPLIVRQNWKTALLSIACLGAILGLPVLHNWIYGGQAVFLPTTAFTKENLVLPPLTLIKGVSETGVLLKALDQLRYLVGVIGWKYWIVFVPMLALLAFWLLAMIESLRNWRKQGWRQRMVVFGLPALYLGVQFFYAMSSVYPRHLVAAYLAQGLVALWVFGMGTKPVGKKSRQADHSNFGCDIPH